MMVSETIKITGHVQVRKNNKVVYEGKNLVVNAGLNLIASRLAGSGSDVPAYMAVGSDGTTPAAGQTALIGTEHARVAATHVSATNQVTYEAVFTGENASQKSVREFGIFNAAAAGTMLARFITELISWDVDDALEVTWSISIGELG